MKKKNKRLIILIIISIILGFIFEEVTLLYKGRGYHGYPFYVSQRNVSIFGSVFVKTSNLLDRLQPPQQPDQDKYGNLISGLKSPAKSCGLCSKNEKEYFNLYNRLLNIVFFSLLTFLIIYIYRRIKYSIKKNPDVERKGS